MAKIVYVFAFVALVQTAFGLDCYSCDDKGSVPCAADSEKWQKVPGCGKVASATLMGACLKKVYTDKSGKEIVERRCIQANKSADNKPTFDCTQSTPDAKISVCQVCTQDLCNSAPAISFSFATLMGVVAAYLIPRYM